MTPMNDLDTIREALERMAHLEYRLSTREPVINPALAALERVSALQTEMEADLIELRADAANLQAVQDFGADWDLYAEPNGKWSIRERSGEITTFNNLGECGSAIRNQNSR